MTFKIKYKIKPVEQRPKAEVNGWTWGYMDTSQIYTSTSSTIVGTFTPHTTQLVTIDMSSGGGITYTDENGDEKEYLPSSGV